MLPRFMKKIGLIFHKTDFIGCISKLDNRYWLETDNFFLSTRKNTELNNKSILPNVFSTLSPH